MSERELWATIIVPFSLFILLSPGIFFNFPQNSSKQCSDLIPLPQKYTFVKGDKEGTSTAENITSETLNGPGMDPIRAARKKCANLVSPSYTSMTQVFVHALVFTFLSVIARHLIL